MLSALFSKPEERATSSANSVWGTWPGDSDGRTSPVSYSTTQAMQLLAVSGCVRLISESIATLPLDVYRETNGVKQEITTPVWLEQPTLELDTVAFLGQIMTSLLTAGNAYLAVTRAGNRIVEVTPIDPSLVHVTRSGGLKVYMVNGKPYPGELLHIPGMMLPGSDVGLSPLDYARATIGVGLEAQSFARDQFENFLNMPGVISYPNKMNPDQVSGVAQMWRKLRQRKGRGLPGVLESGGTWQTTAISNEAAQFLQTQQWTAAQIAAQVYMVDPSDLGIPVGGTTLTYANLEQRNIRRVQVTFLPWIVRVEKALSTLLAVGEVVKMNVDGLLRADTTTRWETYAKAMEINVKAASVGQAPVLLTDEMRDFEDLNKIEEYPGASLLVQPSDTTAAREMNAAELVQKIYLGVGSVVTVEEARKIVEQESGFPLPGAPTSLVPPQTMRSEAPTLTQEPPNVFITNDVHVPEQRTPDVHVEPAAVVVDVQPVNVSVPGAEVRVTTPEAQTTVRRVERDADGRIARIIDEVV